MIEIEKVEKLKRYILFLREEEMNNNYKLSEEQLNFISQVNQELKENPELKVMLNKMLSAKSNREMNGAPVDSLDEKDQFDSVSSSSQNIETKENAKVYVKKAGYVDALVMALVTGFMGGIFTTFLLMACK